jgi:hypothetical protein
MNVKARNQGAARKSRQRGKDVVECALKMKFFFRWDEDIVCSSERVKCVLKFAFSSRKQMADQLGLTDAQLEGAADPKVKNDKCSLTYDPTIRRLSDEVLTTLRDELGFDFYSDVFRKGTAFEFAKAYNDANKSKPTCKPEYLLTTGERERLTAVPLTPEPGEQRTGKHRLASLGMTTKLSNSGENWWIGFDLICRAADGLGVKRGYILLHCGEARAEREQWGFREEHKLPDADVTIRAGAGTEKVPLWFVVAGSGLLDDVIPGEPYCVVTEVAAGDCLSARFSVFVKDYCTQNYICQEDGEPLTRRKKAVLVRIMQMGLPGGEDGETVLCSHDIAFKAAPSIPELNTAAPCEAAPAKLPGRSE